jgi:hypothetical protein
MKIHPAWKMFAWVYLAQFLTALVLGWRLLISGGMGFALARAASFALEASVLVMLGVWMYKLDNRKKLRAPINTTPKDID